MIRCMWIVKDNYYTIPFYRHNRMFGPLWSRYGKASALPLDDQYRSIIKQEIGPSYTKGILKVMDDFIITSVDGVEDVSYKYARIKEYSNIDGGYISDNYIPKQHKVITINAMVTTTDATEVRRLIRSIFPTGRFSFHINTTPATEIFPDMQVDDNDPYHRLFEKRYTLYDCVVTDIKTNVFDDRTTIAIQFESPQSEFYHFDIGFIPRGGAPRDTDYANFIDIENTMPRTPFTNYTLASCNFRVTQEHDGLKTVLYLRISEQSVEDWLACMGNIKLRYDCYNPIGTTGVVETNDIVIKGWKPTYALEFGPEAHGDIIIELSFDGHHYSLLCYILSTDSTWEDLKIIKIYDRSKWVDISTVEPKEFLMPQETLMDPGEYMLQHIKVLVTTNNTPALHDFQIGQGGLYMLPLTEGV